MNPSVPVGSDPITSNLLEEINVVENLVVEVASWLGHKVVVLCTLAVQGIGYLIRGIAAIPAIVGHAVHEAPYYAWEFLKGTALTLASGVVLVWQIVAAVVRSVWCLIEPILLTALHVLASPVVSFCILAISMARYLENADELENAPQQDLTPQQLQDRRLTIRTYRIAAVGCAVGVGLMALRVATCALGVVA